MLGDVGGRYKSFLLFENGHKLVRINGNGEEAQASVDAHSNASGRRHSDRYALRLRPTRGGEQGAEPACDRRSSAKQQWVAVLGG